MKDHIKASLRENFDHFILHLATNDLNSGRQPGIIAKSKVLCYHIKEKRKSISSISNIVQKDEFKSKPIEVNEHFFYGNKYLVDQRELK